jgi:hypothetical protein
MFGKSPSVTPLSISKGCVSTLSVAWGCSGVSIVVWEVLSFSIQLVLLVTLSSCSPVAFMSLPRPWRVLHPLSKNKHIAILNITGFIIIPIKLDL